MNNPLRRGGVLAAVLLLSCVAACTGDDPEPAGPAPSSGATVAPAPKSAPLKVRVTRVNGELSEKLRTQLEANVAKTIGEYVDAAFTGGSYPRSDFGNAFRSFTPGAARTAKGDISLLTNAALGKKTEWVSARRQTAYLSVLAPYRVAAGVTARIDLVFQVARPGKPTQRVGLTGRLLLTHGKDGWEIFGYDVARSSRASGKAGSR